MINMSVDSIWAERSRAWRSRTMARARTGPELAPSACTTRHTIICPTPPDIAQPTDPMMNRAMPATIGGRRPK